MNKPHPILKRNKDFKGPRNFREICQTIYKESNGRFTRKEVESIVTLFFARRNVLKAKKENLSIKVPGIGNFVPIPPKKDRRSKKKIIQDEKQAELDRIVQGWENKVRMWEIQKIRRLNYENLKRALDHNEKYLTMEAFEKKTLRKMRKIPYEYWKRLCTIKLS